MARSHLPQWPSPENEREKYDAATALDRMMLEVEQLAAKAAERAQQEETPGDGRAERAARYSASHRPVDARNHASMLDLFRACATADELQRAVLHFTLDPSFARVDIVHALGVVEREKGWA